MGRPGDGPGRPGVPEVQKPPRPRGGRQGLGAIPPQDRPQAHHDLNIGIPDGGGGVFLLGVALGQYRLGRVGRHLGGGRGPVGRYGIRGLSGIEIADDAAPHPMN